MTDSVKKLDEKIDELINSPRNQEIARSWKPQVYTAKDHWRGIPRSGENLPMIPFTVEPEIPMWAKILGFDVQQFYTVPTCYLENTLAIMIYRFENFHDFTCIEKSVPIWLGAPFESSLLGSGVLYVKDESPWLDRQPLIREPEDLHRLKQPDFRMSGLMPLAHRMYEEISELVEGKYTVVFPEWGRGPFGVAQHIRGLENLLMDMVLRPEWTHCLLRFVTDARKAWVEERARFLQRPVDKGNLYNDEVNCPTLSPQQYEEFVLPYEKELCAFHGGISYWHSCGNTTKLLESIRKIPSIDMFHIGPWTDLQETRRVFGQNTALEKCLMPTADVQLVLPEKMDQKLEYIRSILDGTAYTVRADALQVMRSVREEVEKVKQWVEIAERRLNNRTRIAHA